MADTTNTKKPADKKPVHFYELIRSDHETYDFAGKMRGLLTISLILVIASLAMLPINHFWRGHALNYSTDLRGGSEVQVAFSKEVQVADIRAAMGAGGFEGTEVVALRDADKPNSVLLRFGAVSPVSAEKTKQLEAKLREKVGADGLKKFEFSEGGDRINMRFTKAIEPADIAAVFDSAGVQHNTIQRQGRPEENQIEVILVGLDVEVKKVLEQKLGAGAVAAIPSIDSISASAGRELRDDGLKALLFSIICIMVYIAVRFDFRYGPGTVAALLHDAILVLGAFAITYREFSLTTIAAILTVIGYSMNDTIVVFDRIRENAARLRDRRFDRVVNLSINETLSRTIITSMTVFFVTLAMNIWGTGVIRDFAFAMNVGVVVGTYSSIFVAAPILIWLNDRFFKPAAKTKAKTA